jgi:holo-[acyl-carrier protein] synthase
LNSIGLDIVDTERILKDLNRFGERFTGRILGPRELEIFSTRKNRPEFLAGRFACKEAVIKALGRFLSFRPRLTSIEIINDATGQPELVLPASVCEKLSGHRWMVSISHEKRVAAAVAVILEEK